MFVLKFNDCSNHDQNLTYVRVNIFVFVQVFLS